MYVYLAGLPSRNEAIQSEVLPRIESHLSTYADLSEVKIKERAIAMRIHLTDTNGGFSDGSTVKDLLPDEGKNESLFSYAYRQQEGQWRDSWNRATSDDMKIHLAGHTADPSMDALVKPDHESHLSTYADLKEVGSTIDEGIDRRPRVIIDSGAFTAFTTGKVIDPRDYVSWALDFKGRWEGKFASLYFMNLDVIGDQDASWRNQKIIESLGLDVLPIVTFGASAHVDRALENYPYIALGGLVPYSRDKKKLQAWLDYCFARVMARKKKTGVMPRVHLLGITSKWVFDRYPCFSADSSAWVACLRFGKADVAGLPGLPRYKESSEALSATIHTLRAEIRKYKKMEVDATNLWKGRGIVFNE